MGLSVNLVHQKKKNKRKNMSQKELYRRTNTSFLSASAKAKKNGYGKKAIEICTQLFCRKKRLEFIKSQF
jgi:hypothetical protein